MLLFSPVILVCNMSCERQIFLPVFPRYMLKKFQQDTYIYILPMRELIKTTRSVVTEKIYMQKKRKENRNVNK